jgi:hypothetical protein
MFENSLNALKFIMPSGTQFGVQGVLPAIAFWDTDYSTSTGVATLKVSYGFPDATDSYMRFGTTVDGTLDDSRFELSSTSANSNPVFSIAKGIYTASLGYTGVTGAQYAFIDGAQGFRVPLNMYVYNTAQSWVIVVSPDGTCSRCGADNTDVWTCAGVTCPVVSP